MKFCTYQIVYVTPYGDEIPVYAGAGSDRRSRTHFRRTHNARLAGLVEWCRENGHEMRVDVVERFSTREEAYVAGRDLIAAIGRSDRAAGPLCNVADGGSGLSGWGTKEQRTEIARKGAQALTREDRIRGAEATNKLVTREKRSRAGKEGARVTNNKNSECPVCGRAMPPGPMKSHMGAHARGTTDQAGRRVGYPQARRCTTSAGGSRPLPKLRPRVPSAGDTALFDVAGHT
jgi:hypothetical protein